MHLQMQKSAMKEIEKTKFNLTLILKVSAKKNRFIFEPKFVY